ncbi:MAG TPA: FtsX-like permease family protein [Actinomycetota bacterium]|nr:FtsX-like permease family protein [Actinomycetota bacterium]
MRRTLFWLRWSGRDLRSRWLQVAAIALIVAIGTGMSAALGSVSVWRRDSYDASYALLNAHDVRISLPAGSSLPAGALEDAMRELEERGVVTTAEERLILPTQVDASSGGRTILVPGVLIGIDLGAGGPRLDGIDVTRGRGLRPMDAALPGAALLEAHFADHYALPSAGTILLAGGTPMRYVGAGYTPEYFMVTTPAGGFLAESSFAAVFAPIEIARSIAGSSVSNDLVVRLAPGTGRRAAAADIVEAVRAAAPGIAITVTPIDDDPAYRGLYGDLENDQRTMNSIAYLIFAAAVFAAFNLTSRIVEARRREIGIGMALGQRTSAIATRPLLMGLEIGLLGAVFGIGVGLLIDEGMRSVFASLQPLPVWQTAFQPSTFARAAAIGAVLPLLAAVWPVWRAVRVRPVDAIRTGHLAAKGGRLAPVLQRVTAGRRSLRLMPLRNVLRSPRRTILTAIGIGAAITAMVGVIGLLDTYDATIDRGADEVARGAAGRIEVSLSTLQPVEGPTLGAIAGAEGVEAVQPSLRLAGRLGEAAAAFDVVLETLDLDGAVWHPTIEGRVDPAGATGIVLARKAAEDLGLTPGDLVRVSHPIVAPGDETFRRAATEMRVIGLHPYPMRNFAFLDTSDADAFGLAGAMNAVHVDPAPGADADTITRAVFTLSGVASVQPADATIEILRDLVSVFVDLLRVVEIFVLILALLIAFNAASITVDERAREHATMSAFGVRTRRILAGITAEGLVIGLAGTVIGVVLGRLAVGWLVSGAGEELPDLELFVTVSMSTIATAFLLGVIAVGLAPLLTARRLVRMDVPSTLRVME